MNHLKQHARDMDGLTHFLTYADINAVGYFIKQVLLSLFVWLSKLTMAQFVALMRKVWTS